MKRYLYVVLGSLIIGLTYNLFFLPYDLVPNGVYGFGALLNYEFGYEPALFLIIVNLSFMIISYFTMGWEKTRSYLLPSLLIPIIIFLTENINSYVEFGNMEMFLITIVGGVLTGFGYSLIYKQGFSVGGMDVLQDTFNSVRIYRRKIFTYVIEVVIVCLTIAVLDLESAIYSAIAIVTIRYMATKSKIGISSNKTFFIITTMEKEVKDYIINDLHYDLTEFNVRGGYSNNKSKILMTSIDTKEYYRLKEGVTTIDPKAFISIIDGYEVINKNVSIKGKKN